jgi:hypothetical protein
MDVKLDRYIDNAQTDPWTNIYKIDCLGDEQICDGQTNRLFDLNINIWQCLTLTNKLG